ncbi:restriction endonuclease [Solirubrobacter phytolaccae]|uniref:Restriction endonuclease n=1 Tax=Solirubrobacter phytolaccae TaxID=1404360 RepID=A0A9X3SAI9_9ACTN|nr:hypothetical protein [Solirubrobacter phytolaccae]MDA0180305.1 restriction endonuclease [Solirubrobacter phytolaccae]
MRVDETWHRLRAWTSGQATSERLAAQVLYAEGFRDLDPSHPLGGPDGGADALARKDGRTWVMAVYFPLDEVRSTAVQAKAVGDAAGVAGNAAYGMAFVTNQHLTRGERKALAKAVGCPVDIFHLERLVHVLDRPAMAQVREQYLDIPANAAGLQAAARLDELARASDARCVGRWMAIGLPREEAEALATGATGVPDDDLVPTTDDRVVVWTAELGSGKSIALERVHQRAITAAQASSSAPVPVFLTATECASGLQAAVRTAAAEVGEPRLRGANVVVDGIDEAGLEAAERLLEQARVLASTWPNTTVLLTSRPITVLAAAPEHHAFPPLSEPERHACIELGAGREVRTLWDHGLPAEVRAVMSRPFFALLAGLWLRENESVPRAPVDLLGLIGRRATAKGADEVKLRALAVRAVARNLAPVPEAEVGTAAAVESLMLTGIINRRPGGVVFALPALAQWFAAQSLLEGETQPESLLEAPEDLELWRYPVALAVALGSWQQSNACLAPLLREAPGFAFRVLDVAFAQNVTFGNPAPPWREAGTQVREALQALLDATGEARTLASVTHADGRLLPMAVQTGDDRVSVACWRGDEERPDFFPWPPDLHMFAAGWDWGSMRMTRVGPTATWAWQWARDSLRHEIGAQVKERSLPIPPEGPLADEVAWDFACEQSKVSALFAERLAIQPLLEFLEPLTERAEDAVSLTVQLSPTRRYDARAIQAYLRRRVDAGQTELLAPLPTADVRTGGGWIGEFYTPERLVAIATEQYRRVIVAYRQLVTRWFAPLSHRLEHHALMPLRVVAQLYPGDRDGFGFIPSLSGWLEALPPGAPDEVVITLADHHYDFEAGRLAYPQQLAARPVAARWLSGSQGGLSFEVGDRNPVELAVYAWLAGDLRRLGLTDASSGLGNGFRATVWDV